jgi:hypothetical protein
MLKTVSSVANAIGALNYKGTWNASTNTPAIASGVGTQGDYYVVSVAGATDLNGITNWGVGDWAAFNGSVWQRVEGGADGNFVNLEVTGTSKLTGNVGVGQASGANSLIVASVAEEYSAKIFNQFNGAAGNGLWVDTRYNTSTNVPFRVTSNSGTSELIQVSGTGNVTLGIGNLVIGTSGKGIDFSATAGTGTSELLDDYEEGTWTPAIISGGSRTYTSQIGSYTKVGRLVTVQIQIIVNVATSPSGTMEVSGLPFTVSAGSKGVVAIVADQTSASAIQWVGYPTASSQNIRIYTYASGTLSNPGAYIASGSQFNITASYEV